MSDKLAAATHGTPGIRGFEPGHSEKRGLIHVRRSAGTTPGIPADAWKFSVQIHSDLGDAVVTYFHGALIRMLWDDEAILTAAAGKLLAIAASDPKAVLEDGRLANMVGPTELWSGD